MPLSPYTSTYTDVDTNIIDSDDLVDEFWRVSDYINTWADSQGSAGITNFYEKYVTITENIVHGNPGDGIIQVVYVEADVENIAINFAPREEGDTYRIYMTLRFKSKDTVFTVSGPGGETHMFGLNRETYSPGQTITDGYYTAVIMATYGDSNGVMINVHAHNAEDTTVSADDALTVVAL